MYRFIFPLYIVVASPIELSLFSPIFISIFRIFLFCFFVFFALPTLINFLILSTGFHIYFHLFFGGGMERVINGIVGKATVNLC